MWSHQKNEDPWRHLNTSQRAMLGARLEPLYAEEAAGRLKTNVGGKHVGVPNLAQADQGKARDKAAAVVGVSHNYVSMAKIGQGQAWPGLAGVSQFRLGGHILKHKRYSYAQKIHCN